MNTVHILEDENREDAPVSRCLPCTHAHTILILPLSVILFVLLSPTIYSSPLTTIWPLVPFRSSAFAVIQDVDNASLEAQYQSFASLMEQRLAELFVLASQQGSRFRRATTVGSYTVQVRNGQVRKTDPSVSEPTNISRMETRNHFRILF